MELSEWEQDAALLDEWRGGDRPSGERLFARHGDSVLRFFRNKVRLQEVEELSQETFLRLIKAKDRIEEGRSFRAYVLGIARHVLLEHLRATAPGQMLDPAVHRAVDLTPGPSTILVEREEQVLLVNALRYLPLEQQILLELYYWEQLKAPKLARIMNVNPSTMRSRIQKARDALRAAINELAAKPELVHSTLAGLDHWAEEIRVEHLRGLTALE